MTTRRFRDYLAVEVRPDGTRHVLGGYSARVGDAFEVARTFWPEVFSRGAGRIEADERAGSDERRGVRA